MGTLWLRNAFRSAYAVSALKIEGVPDTQIEGDVEPSKTLTVTITCTEDPSGDLRAYLMDNTGFWGECDHGEYGISWRDARLVAALPDRDYGRSELTFQFSIARSSVLKLTRPMGRPAFDHLSARRNQELFLANGVDKARRERLQLDAVQADLDRHFEALIAVEADLAAREAIFVSAA